MIKLAQIPFNSIGIGTKGAVDLDNAKLGNIIAALIPYILSLAGFGLMIYLILGGFEYLTSAGDPKKTDSAKKKLTTALFGFIIIFSAFWVVQLFGNVLNIGPFKNVFLIP